MKNAANRIDCHVGKKIRHRRLLIGLTQMDLAEAAGVSFQQMQKYETAENRVSASRLWELSTILGVSVEFFFEGAEDKKTGQNPTPAVPNEDKEAFELIRSYFGIAPAKRRAFLDVARSMRSGV